ncbi:MAG: DUF1580 domain-containing protein [Chitinophagaceae bacterium]|nr:MAG: DUF1580 domain-containing protein [Chitinophagaceae bacterium]
MHHAIEGDHGENGNVSHGTKLRWCRRPNKGVMRQYGGGRRRATSTCASTSFVSCPNENGPEGTACR